MRPVALTVAGSDSGGGAGVQADLKTFEACGAFGTSALIAVTAQNTTGVTHSAVLDPETVRAQYDAVVSDFDVAAAKTGMLGGADVVEEVADAIAAADFPVVVDPVVVAQSGDRLLTERGVDAVRDDLLPEAALATPNVPEAELLAGVEIEDEADLRAAAEAVRDLGPDAVLLTGGHLDGNPVDVYAGETTRAFSRERVDTDDTHGSGCTLSAAIAARLAAGDDPERAVERGVDATASAIESDLSLGAGSGPVDHAAIADGRRAVPDGSRAPESDDATDAIEAVRDVAAVLEREWPPELVPEVGTNVAVAPADATAPEDVVAVDGRLHATKRGVRAVGGVAPGASSHVARFLLGVRERDPRVSAAGNVRWSREREAALRERWDVERIDRTDEPADADGTMDWSAREAMAGRERAPDAVVDRGAVGKEAMIRVVAADADALLEKLSEVASLERDADVV
ncbi:phosphomethylpyrimidine kinase / phosphomethylpyrimidine phosphate kinase / thiamine-phosphate synthase [Halobacterium hubeiense]|uniref:Phosphomethylpyrimidine kinase / phosphomethylpyrimidine phosphate kinase / thiamine-phosphate synthase n=1 Tax=Halobacterium hubeiense TaxID=1407499 RepID=A0A0U5CV80_9EURY|nr:bifunctional hydroxymethylpyrimidine kinase/phosphomethylpyrimidine kinase [Halobacterium hubeiense]CQH45301.1 phosphomethylpyrimidine kinase / phosphomethylpyrimidine phosphate kinase / thiamine-phosphate synthase [Halobacterium hubeiense]